MRMILAALALAAAAPAAAQQHGQHGQHGAVPAAPGQERHDHAQGEDQRAVLATVDRLFAALAAKDRAALLAEVVPEGRATATVAGPNPRFNSLAWPAFADHLAQIPGRPVERLIDPHVHVEGDIAMIWTRYEIALDGRFLHCGVDHFDLVRREGRWRVLNLTWTQQTVGCPGR
ncbi:MAG TPA: nuclear transport factor 2 family protein [Allosphingosinicella sp.]|jgi:ketosteroid isomerase-like protein